MPLLNQTSLPPAVQYIPLSAAEEKTYGLNEDEILWRNRQDILERHGYVLRPRFRRGWMPSWKIVGKENFPVFCEDSFRHHNEKTIDATQQSDGLRIYLKIVPATGHEQMIAKMLSPKDDLQISKNHCVPIVDSFVDGKEMYLAMPILIKFDRPPFFSVDEVLDFIRQTLEGLSYIHSQNVAHRDCSYLNIMMDTSKLYEHGIHPTYPIYTEDGITPSNPRRRRDVSRVWYYFTDFGISTLFKDSDKERLVTGLDGQDKEVPELSDTVPYDPFAVDVFIMGNLYRKELLDKYSNLAFMTPLIDAMTRQEPKARPSIDEAIKQFEQIISRQRSHVLRWRLKPNGYGRLRRLLLDVGWFAHESFMALKKSL